MFVVALALSAIAAFYSIVGLTAIFAAAVVPIVVMGTILEIAKVVVTLWLHEYWRQCRLLMKLYLVPAVFTLMVITSMGIFGFLSKAHLDQTVPTGDVAAQVQLIDEKINNERDTIANARSLLAQLDKAVVDIGNAPDREVNGRTISSAERALQVRRQQAQDRARLTATIEQAQARIVRLQEEKAPFAKDLRKIEAEVGPIKYIAALIYGDNPDANLLEKAVRWVIIILVIVFDPLAIMMLLAATESRRWTLTQRADAASSDALPPPPPAAESPTEPVVPATTEKDPTEPPQPVNSVDAAATVIESTQPVAPTAPQPIIEPDPVIESQPLAQPVEPVIEPATISQPVTPTLEDDPLHDDDPAIKSAMKRWKQENPDKTLKEMRHRFAQGQIDRLPWMDMLPPRTGFGPTFPSSPRKGDTYMRTDRMPNQMYKFNGYTWIEVDRNGTDTYTYDEAYIDHLISEISAGRYNPEWLNEREADEIQRRIKDTQ